LSCDLIARDGIDQPNDITQHAVLARVGGSIERIDAPPGITEWISALDMREDARSLNGDGMLKLVLREKAAMFVVSPRYRSAQQ
jgi:hypothetical protein